MKLLLRRTLQGLTAHYLLHESWELKAGQTVLVQAAAGGVGLLLCQWAKHKGATVLGTVGNEEKAAYAAAHGCDHPIVYTQQDFADSVRDITGGKGVDVVYDAIGKDTFEKGLGCLAERGRMVSYGVASGPYWAGRSSGAASFVGLGCLWRSWGISSRTRLSGRAMPMNCSVLSPKVF